MSDAANTGPNAERATASGRALFWISFYAVILMAWIALFLGAQTGTPDLLPGVTMSEFWASLCLPATEAEAQTLFAMWALMTAAMMLPGFAPALRVFGEIGGVGASDLRAMTALVAGYSFVWLVFSVAATGAQVALSRAGALAPDGTSLAPWLTAALMLAAGAYQLSRAKAACLAKCRHPLMFFIEHWRPGAVAAFGMGARLGAFCVGCCWVLMLLGFVGGAMNLIWMGIATLFMTFEKLPGLGSFVTRPAGLALLAAGAALMAQTLNLI